jgi:hypothetical protein
MNSIARILNDLHPPTIFGHSQRSSIMMLQRPPNPRKYHRRTTLEFMMKKPEYMAKDIYNPNPHQISMSSYPSPPGMTDHLLQEIRKVLPELPDNTRRIWVYETEPVSAVTQVIRLNEKHVPIRLYQLLSPLTKRIIKRFYGCLPPDKPRRAPPWMNRDYSRCCQRVWQSMTIHITPSKR